MPVHWLALLRPPRYIEFPSNTVHPARAEYVIGSPIFDDVTVHLDNGKDFVIVAEKNSAENVYIQVEQRNECTVAAVFEAKKEIPD
jgi:putative alpha-1,2-mannosidase